MTDQFLFLKHEKNAKKVARDCNSPNDIEPERTPLRATSTSAAPTTTAGLFFQNKHTKTNRNSYDNVETDVGKRLARRIQMFWVQLFV